MKPLRAIRHWIEYLGAQMLFMLAQSLPLSRALRLGEMAGDLWSVLARKRWTQAVDNLRQAFPELTRQQAEDRALQVFRHFGRAAVETAVGHRLLGRTNFREHVIVRGEDQYLRLAREGKGVLVVGAHLGVWELFGMVLSDLGTPLHIVYKPPENPLIDRLLQRRRALFGQQMVNRSGALRALLRVLRGGGYIAILADQHERHARVRIPFFNRPAATTVGPAALSVATGAPVVIGYGCRLPGTYRFELCLSEPIRPTASGDRRREILRMTEEITQRMEDGIRKHPEQWTWMHRRWRRPKPWEKEAGEPHARPTGRTR